MPCRLISFPVSNLHQSKPDHDPDHFADTGNQCSINPVGSGKGEATYGKCKASFTSTELHRQEEQKIGQQGGKGSNQAAVGKADGFVCRAQLSISQISRQLTTRAVYSRKRAE